MHLFFCLLILIMPGIALALPSNYPLQMRMAQAYLENQQYSQAREIYQNLLQDSTVSWQRAVLMYNIGTVFLEEGEWDKANETFQAVSYDNELGPLLRYRVMYNFMINHVKQGLSLKAKDPELALKWVTVAEKELSVLTSPYCDLEYTLGAKECKESETLVTLKNTLPQIIASMKQEIDAQRIHNANVMDALKYLSESTEQAIKDVEFLNEIPKSTTDLLKKYKLLFSARLNNLKPLWDNTNVKIAGNKKDQDKEKRLEIFQKANIQFKAGISAIESQDFVTSKISFKNTLLLLKELMAIPPPPSASKQPPPPQEEAKDPSQQKKQSDAENIEQLLLRTYQEDKLPTPKSQSSEKRELRPW